METSEGSQVWGEHYDRKASDLLAIQRELAREITERLHLRLRGEDEKRMTKGDTGNTEAYQLYLKGRYFWNKRTAENIKKGTEFFQQAIDRDPNYALAYVGLADSYGLMELAVGTPSSETLPKARAAVERALQIDNSLAQAHASLGMIEQYSWNFGEAEREFKRAIELNPNYPTAHLFYSMYLRTVTGRVDEAITETKLAQQLDPLSPINGNMVAQAYLAKGELDAAIEAEKLVIELDPKISAAYRVLGIAYRKQGRYDEAVAAFEKGVELSGREGQYIADLGVCYAMAGNRARAQVLLKELEEQYERREALGQYIADLYAALGYKEQAFAWLEKDFKARSGLLPFIAYVQRSDILRDALSSDPRWNDLLRRIGLPQQ